MNRVIEALKAGRPAIFPTDTVYGLGVAVRYVESPQELFDLKRRDPSKPVAWLIADVADLDRYGADITDEARQLAEKGWPGALTVIVKASAEVPPAYRSSQGTIGLRVPASETACALIREVGPIAATSANHSGAPAPCVFSGIDPGLLADVPAAIARDGECGAGASTVIDASTETMHTIRS